MNSFITPPSATYIFIAISIIHIPIPFSCAKTWAKGLLSQVQVYILFDCYNIFDATYSPFKTLETKLIGGVTLNHLSWAALGGGRTLHSLHTQTCTHTHTHETKSWG